MDVATEVDTGRVTKDDLDKPEVVRRLVDKACARIREVHEAGGALLVLTRAGMSVSSGVPVFRNSDGSMSPDFLRFLGNYNEARRRHGLEEVDDWFGFSVARMFDKRTEVEAWHYWRWRILRALVDPAEDYRSLQHLCEIFGDDRVFVVTSNCDQLHVRSGTDPASIKEIHGSLGTLQCSAPCCEELHSVDQAFFDKLKSDPDWVPRCPHCRMACLRPNVMIFDDNALVESKLAQQEKNYSKFQSKFNGNWAVLEIGAGVVVPSIRFEAEHQGISGRGLIRINPSIEECKDSELDGSEYFPLVSRSNTALEALYKGL